MKALTNARHERVTGAVMVNGEMICFDAEDYDLAAGTQAVVIGERGEIYVAPIAADHPEQKARMARNRSALVPFVSGRYPPGTPEHLQVKVLGRYVPVAAPVRAKARHLEAI
ncbi:hypothetical protein [Neokomagataea anthophila]|uniref:Uncharacterized protein n=1 Tax=Neokomagataea anthophila TaxID=2826925 RepID=A0ABS5E808_9PROT|nr:hypothetical protein [Neokomagataea anthophila]MBR0560038.1 hypothetical protein [Neokomagataea anthophila]